ncbi:MULTISPECIES: hypothetical protein [unclassified Mesorhizobium]|uniref:hypothetical protein n=1 Tax=unclassified Mesorhizobium TaxID=325217 RepID=UPI001FE12EDC|nr:MULTISPECIES: hypothetical protein [unclassified Mesorhizobium]
MPTLVDQLPDGENWLHEVKFDGYRSQLVIDEDGTRITRATVSTGPQNIAPWSRIFAQGGSRNSRFQETFSWL